MVNARYETLNSQFKRKKEIKKETHSALHRASFSHFMLLQVGVAIMITCTCRSWFSELAQHSIDSVEGGVDLFSDLRHGRVYWPTIIK